MGLKVGEIVFGRYRVVRAIKSGGMGAVYEAADTRLADQACAMKEIHEAALAGPNAAYIKQRFLEEMRFLSALDHPFIPKVRDFLTQGQNVYLVMDLVRGKSLDEELEDSRQLAGCLPDPEKAVADAISILETLAYLHELHPPVIHRDVKPANVLRDHRTGGIKLVDFGLSRQLDSEKSHTSVGTLGYCAPEQMVGRAEERSDLYSVGVTLCYLLTGKAPEPRLLEPHCPNLSGMRPGLTPIIERATQPFAASRFASAREMILALQGWLAHNPIETTIVSDPLSLSRKIAILLTSLPKEVSTQLYHELSPDRIKEIDLEIARLPLVEPELRARVVHEFLQSSRETGAPLPEVPGRKTAAMLRSSGSFWTPKNGLAALAVLLLLSFLSLVGILLARSRADALARAASTAVRQLIDSDLSGARVRVLYGPQTLSWPGQTPSRSVVVVSGYTLDQPQVKGDLARCRVRFKVVGDMNEEKQMDDLTRSEDVLFSLELDQASGTWVLIGTDPRQYPPHISPATGAQYFKQLKAQAAQTSRARPKATQRPDI